MTQTVIKLLTYDDPKKGPAPWNVETGLTKVTQSFELGKDVETGAIIATPLTGMLAGQAAPLDAVLPDWVKLHCMAETGRAISITQVNEIIAQCQAWAVLRGDWRKVARRAWRDGSRLVIDFGPVPSDDGNLNPNLVENRYVIVEDGAWRMVSRPPKGVAFYRGAQFAPLPTPVADATWQDAFPLFRHMPVEESVVPLLMAYTAAIWALSNTQLPLLLATGKPGQGKSWIGDTILWLTDPVSTASPDKEGSPGIQMPKKEDDLAVAGSDVLLLYVDNMSKITKSMSDIITALATGRIWKKRELYTNKGTSVTSLQHPAILNGVNPTGFEPDVARRTIHIEAVDPIPPDDRQTGESMAEWRARQLPAAVGGILDLAAGALAILPTIQEAGGTFTDWRRWLRACDRYMDTNAYDVYEQLLRNEVSDAALDNVVGRTMLAKADLFRGMTVTLSASELYERLRMFMDSSDARKLASPQAFGRELSMVADSLTRRGWIVESSRTSTKRGWTIQAPDGDDPEQLVAPFPRMDD
ncbi:hypothetical protein [Bifidobacterium sp. SO4]|uniref:hypothetical protein n=1 Tax=Bifidobacterium sp. SO4 TaxID=2809030 RepID=UPI001BDD5BB7|nr:hypothetical protein [Bifidobacterium sp. SO4]MBT1171002.1 hypothetical protein [Bifidobacterium sp. SO4]